MTIANQITITALPQQEKTLKEQLNDLVSKSILEKGCQKFELYQLYDKRDQFFIIEIWKHEKAYKKHLESSTYLTLKETIQNMETHPLKLTQCLTKLGLKEQK